MDKQVSSNVNAEIKSLRESSAIAHYLLAGPFTDEGIVAVVKLILREKHRAQTGLPQNSSISQRFGDRLMSLLF